MGWLGSRADLAVGPCGPALQVYPLASGHGCRLLMHRPLSASRPWAEVGSAPSPQQPAIDTEHDPEIADWWFLRGAMPGLRHHMLWITLSVVPLKVSVEGLSVPSGA